MAKRETHDTFETLSKATGPRRVAKLGWATLSKIYQAAPARGAVRRLIQSEARRCGYSIRKMMKLHG